MELPTELREGIDRLLEGIPLLSLQQAAAELTRRYRAEVQDGKLHLADDLSVRAYLTTRLPATYAAIRRAFDMVADVDEDFAPRSLLDVGAGPGSALWAAAQCWPSLERAELLEASPAVRTVGEALSMRAGLSQVRWHGGVVEADLAALGRADLVALAYVLDELSPQAAATTIEALWDRTTGILVIVEPGTPAGWKRITAARERLLGLAAHVVSPCAHDAVCPLREPDWCHFAQRVARSRLHRLAKGGEVPWEDEKFIFVAVSRRPARARPARVLAPPRGRSGKVSLKLCEPDGAARAMVATKRDVALYRTARRLSWGDALWRGESDASPG